LFCSPTLQTKHDIFPLFLTMDSHSKLVQFAQAKTLFSDISALSH
jgi:hypothetical protein